MNEQPVYSPVHDRARAQLEAASDAIAMPDSEHSNVADIAERRTARHRRTVMGGAVAACTIGLVTGLVLLHDPSSPEITPQDTLAAPTVEPAPSATATVQPALLGEPAFVWKVVEPAQGESVTSTFDAGGDLPFPGFAVSTAPGRSNDYDNIQPVIWRTDDGISWQPTDLRSPFEANGIWNTASSGGRLFSVGTAPGVAATDPAVGVQVAITDESGSSWNTVDLPYDATRLDSLEFVHAGIQVTNAALDDGILVAVSEDVYLDFPTIMQQAQDSGVDVDLDRGVLSSDDNGVTMLADSCDSDGGAALAGATVTTVVFGPGGTVTAPPDAPSGTEPPDSQAPVEPCDTVTLSWSELGVPQASVDAIDQPSTEFFHVGLDGAVTPVESPVPGARMSMTVAGPAPVFVVPAADGDPGNADLVTYQFEGGAWQSGSMPNVGWMNPPQSLGDLLVGYRYSPAGTQATTVHADGAVTSVDIAPLYGPYSLVNTDHSARAGDRLVSAVQRYSDPIAEAGGVEYSRDGVTVRMDTWNTPKIYLDTASGQPIDSSLIANDDQTGDVVILDTDGGERMRLTQDELYTNLDGLVSNPQDAEWSIATTADGVTFSVESVADLLGVDPTAISYVPRISSDGNQVIVAVSLNDRWPDESRKQILLVGTPKG